MDSKTTTIILTSLAVIAVAGALLYSFDEPPVFGSGPLTVETQEVITWVDAAGKTLSQRDGARIVYHLAEDGSLATEEFIPDRDGKIRRGRRIAFANGYDLFLDDRTGTRNSTHVSNVVRKRVLAGRNIEQECRQEGMELMQSSRTEHGLVITRTLRPNGQGYIDQAPALGCEAVGHQSFFDGRGGARQTLTRRIVRVTPTVSESVFRVDEAGYSERSPEEHWRIELRDRGFTEAQVDEMVARKGIANVQRQYGNRHTSEDQRPDWTKTPCCGN